MDGSEGSEQVGLKMKLIADIFTCLHKLLRQSKSHAVQLDK
jgi:hypothetical protein